jgi:hypothetical protein
MYTQFIIDVKLRGDTPGEVIECLYDMTSNRNNPLFTFQRNPLDNYCNSNDYPKSFNGSILKAHGEIKNHWNDIQKFIDFITPYVAEGFLEGGAFGKSLYEEFDEWIYYSK